MRELRGVSPHDTFFSVFLLEGDGPSQWQKKLQNAWSQDPAMVEPKPLLMALLTRTTDFALTQGWK